MFGPVCISNTESWGCRMISAWLHHRQREGTAFGPNSKRLACPKRRLKWTSWRRPRISSCPWSVLLDRPPQCTMGTATLQGLKPSFGFMWPLSLPPHPTQQANPTGCKPPQIHCFLLVAQPHHQGFYLGIPLPGLSAFPLTLFVLCLPAS